MSIDLNALGEFETKSGENAKSIYSLGTFVRASFAIKPAIGLISSREELGNALKLSDTMYTTKVSLSGSIAAAVNSEVYGYGKYQARAGKSWVIYQN